MHGEKEHWNGLLPSNSYKSNQAEGKDITLRIESYEMD